MIPAGAGMHEHDGFDVDDQPGGEAGLPDRQPGMEPVELLRASSRWLETPLRPSPCEPVHR